MRLLASLLTLPMILMLLAAPAEAGLSRADLAALAAAPPADARLAPELAAPDLDGRRKTIGEALAGKPAFLVFVDYGCNTLCGSVLALLANAIDQAHLPRSSFHMLVLGIDPQRQPGAARVMADREIPPDLRSATVFLLPDPPTTLRATKALGYRFAYDASIDQLAHPAAIYVIAPDGAVTHLLSPFALANLDLQKLLATPSPQGPGLYDRLHLLCYAYDPVTGRYTARIDLLLKLAAGATVLALGSVLLMLGRRGRRLG